MPIGTKNVGGTLSFRSVELFGLPGAGTAELLLSLQSANQQVVIDGSAVVQKLSFTQCFRKRPASTALLMVQLLPVALELRKLAARQLVVSSLRQRCVEARGDSVVIFRDGICSEVWRQQMAGNKLSDWLISRVLRAAAANVVVEPSHPTLKRRLKRERSLDPISRSLRNRAPQSDTWLLAESAYERTKRLLGSKRIRSHVAPEADNFLETGIQVASDLNLSKPLLSAQEEVGSQGDPVRAKTDSLSFSAQIAAAVAADKSKDWLEGAKLWEAVFRKSTDSAQRRRAGRRAAMSYRMAGQFEGARRQLRDLIRAFVPDEMTWSEIARFERALEAAEAPHWYWHERRHLLYLKVVHEIGRRIGSNAQSVVDIGSAGTPVIEWFQHVPERASVDLRNPYQGSGVDSVKSDFLDWTPSRRFNLGLCLQVLEHVHEPQKFAQRLMEHCEVVVISVPYLWPEGKVKSHVNDPVDEDKIANWFGRPPNYSYRIAELTGSERIICVYDTESTESWSNVKPERFRFRWSLDGAAELLGDEANSM